jgi:pimeloyl-ACP methyl ester carboxylesterase
VGDPGPGVVSIGSLADDLRRLQDAAALEPPFVIVASSMGGLVAEMFARRYPERVAGLVVLDGATSDSVARHLPRSESIAARAACSASTLAGRLGAIRLLDPFALRASESDAAARSAALMYGAQPWVAVCAVIRGLRATMQEFELAPVLRADLPLAVLTAERTDGILPPIVDGYLDDLKTLGTLRARAHQRLAQRSTRGLWHVVPGSDHLIASSQPQAVVDAVLELLAQIR